MNLYDQATQDNSSCSLYLSNHGMLQLHPTHMTDLPIYLTFQLLIVLTSGQNISTEQLIKGAMKGRVSSWSWETNEPT